MSFTLTPIALTANARTILEKRYLRPGETPEERFWTVAQHVAAAEAQYDTDQSVERRWAERFYQRMANLEFLPNSPTLVNPESRDETRGCLSACFYVPVGDSLEGILEARRQAAWIQRYGGGVGFSFGRIRPEGSPIKSTHGKACGPVAVLRDFDMLSETFTQGGAFRKGAMMGILPIGHPDIQRFIHCKDGGGDILNFNISVAVDDDFMKALEGQSPYIDFCPTCDYATESCAACVATVSDSIKVAYSYPLEFDGVVHRWVDARDLWREICESAHTTGDPGIVFIDAMNNANRVPHLYTLEGTNPCSEIPLGDYEPCNLLSIGLPQFLSDGVIDWGALRECVHDGIRFLDNVVTVNKYPTPEVTAAALLTRKLGLGVMGWHDLLIASGIPYASTEAVKLGERLMKFINDEARAASEWLAIERGVYPGWYGSRDEEDGLRVRNVDRTAIAPTGTIALIGGYSSGIEPHYSLGFVRRMEDGTLLDSRVDAYVKWAEEHPAEPTPEYLKTAMEIAPHWHIAHQAAFQRYTDLAISKTINLPNDATVDDIDIAYRTMFDLGCKGGTVYRDGSRVVQVLTSNKETDNRSTNAHDVLPNNVVLGAAWAEATAPNSDLRAFRHRFSVGGLNGYIIASVTDDNRIIEVFLPSAKSGSTIQGLLTSLSVTISTALQHGVPLLDITRKLRSMAFEPSGMTTNADIRTTTSIVDYVARYLEQLALRFADTPIIGTAILQPQIEWPVMDCAERAPDLGSLCPECGSARLYHKEGCVTCDDCGFSRCG